MENCNSIRIKKADFFRLPDDMRRCADGCLMVLRTINGHAEFVPAIIV